MLNKDKLIYAMIWCKQSKISKVIHPLNKNNRYLINSKLFVTW